ncbi:MAG: PKD domain-containing protein [Bacteroidia bacterium]|nr:PKD domain-containing protein [Bacteroidia bacterium]
MKKHLYLVILTLIPCLLQAQITLYSTDIAMVGDTILRAVDTVPAVSEGNPGANQTWDFSGAIDDELVVTRVVTPASTPYSGNYPASNLAMTNDNVNFVFFTLDTLKLDLDGIAGDLLGNGNTVSAEFSPNVTVYQFPLNYGNTQTDNYAFDETVSGNGFDILFGFSVYQIRLQHSAVTFDTVDAWGTVITPYGSYNCLRNKHVEHSTDVISYKLFSFSGWTNYATLTDTATSYNWLGKESGLAIAELTFDSLDNPNRLTYYREAPLPGFSVAHQPLGVEVFTDNSSGKVDNWLWDFGDGNTSSLQNPTHTFGINGTFTVCQTVSNSAGSGTICDTVTITDAVGVGENLILKGVEMYPNPVLDRVWLQVDPQFHGQKLAFTLFDLEGKMVFSQVLQLEERVEIRLPDLKNGIYLYQMHLTDLDLRQQGKLLVSH